ncbi:unnamed protein product [Mesocestoides corti]|uniref:VWFA domain-containing protein n=1 Tax=Mesocestoides corti TaxID=53468 RepID=A0A0R3UQK2_MESCO|nr:unnamed protein product [Mesocestoides corti]
MLRCLYFKATFLGVMGVDLHVADLFDQVVHFGGNPPSGFVFVVDAETGLSVYHPAALRELLTSFHPHPTPPILPTKSVHDDDVGGGGPIFATPRVADGPPSIGEPILHADVRQLERVPGFGTRVLPRILRGEVNGTAELLVEIFALIAATGIWSADEGSPVSEVDGSPGHSRGNTVRVKVTYRWRRITDPATQFAVVMRSFEVENSTPSRQLLELTPPFESCYHRLDLFKRDQACLYLRQLATFSYNTVYLPPRTFMRPFEHLTSAGGAETADQVRHMVAYLTDQTSLISNPGLVAAPPGARTAVAVVERIGKFWRQRGGAGGASKFGKHIIRRYVSTDTGIMLMWPGTLMPTNYDATTRLWYLRAVQNAGRLVFTGPYLDDGGAGSIVTISYAIFEGNQSGVHTPGIGRVQAVIAMDVPHRLFDHLLATWLPAWCTPRRPRRGGGKRARNDSKTPGLPISSLGSASTRSSRILLDILRDRGMLVEGNSEGEEEGDAIEAESRDPTKCILMDDRGYLIAHPGLTEPKIAGPLESGHINHREPMVAADLLNHVDFVKKMSCVSHTHRSLQRFYVFNTSHTEHRRRNDKAAPSCRAAFCSCSTKDRRCLSCGRMEQRECECPCECPVSVGVGLVSSSPSSNTTATTSEALPVCVPLNLQAPLLPMPKAATAASWKALASLPDAPPLCQQSGSLSHRVPVASLHEWLLLFNASANESLPKNFDSGGSLVPAWGPVDCGTIGRRVIECVATIGCEFCSLRSDGQALENGGFCAPMDVCFGGVVGAVSPYSSVTTVPLSFFPSAPTSLEENWPFLFPPPPSLLPPGHYRHLPPKTSSSAAQFYHYYYYHHHHHYYHGSSAAAAAAENLYVSPYALARHYFPGSLSSVGEVSDGSMAGWSNSISSPVGPVAGAVMAIFIVVILGVYCLRHQTANRLRPAAPDDALLSAGTTNAAPGLEVGRDGGPEGQGNNSSQSGNGGFGRARSSENPPNDATDNDKPPPAAGAVAITTKATGSSSGGCGGDGRGTSVSGDTDSESELGGRHRSALPAPAEARTTGATTGGAAAIIIEGVGVFVKSNVFLDDDDDDEDDVAEAEEVRSLALAEFVSDPTAVSPYRVTTSTAVSAKRPTLDDTVTTASSSAATTTDNGYVSNERPSSSCAESSSIPDSERQNAVVKGGGVAADAHSPTRDPDYVAGVGGVGGAGSEAWVGTLILGPGMDDVMCAEEMEHQLLLSKKVRLASVVRIVWC